MTDITVAYCALYGGLVSGPTKDVGRVARLRARVTARARRLWRWLRGRCRVCQEGRFTSVCVYRVGPQGKFRHENREEVCPVCEGTVRQPRLSRVPAVYWKIWWDEDQQDVDFGLQLEAPAPLPRAGPSILLLLLLASCFPPGYWTESPELETVVVRHVGPRTWLVEGRGWLYQTEVCPLAPDRGVAYRTGLEELHWPGLNVTCRITAGYPRTEWLRYGGQAEQN